MAASYFHGNSEVQGNGDVLQTLILMNPAYVGYSDNHHQLPPPPPAANFTFLNSNSSATASQIPHFAGIPVQAAASSPPHQQQDVSELHRGGALPSFHYNLYNPLIDGGAAREVTRARQGLSLSLSSQQPMPSQPPPPPPGVEEVRVFGWAAPENVVLSCKYLKVAQQLLDEVVNIGKETKDDGRESAKEYNGQPKNTAEAAAGDGGAELTTAQKQEIQMKKAKLVDMLDEVEQRYKQYEQQMQMVIRWFGEAAGAGPTSAKPYTALALQTISKQFRCLKDAIMSQIRAASKNLGEEDHFGGKIEASRLKYSDHQRALQQQFSNAWRPQRGLPERAVSVLRAWLFQHFLHPYPKDTDKIMLAKRAGLTRSQVSNWFINARVRLWKPMVEEMYTEEMMGQRRNNGSSEDEVQQVSTSKSTSSQEIHNNKNTSSPTTPTVKNNNNVRFSLIESSPKKDSSSSSSITRNADASPSPPLSMQAGASDVERQSREGFTIRGAPPSFYGTAYHPMVGMEQFQPSPYSAGNGVSLTLGLQHCENRGVEGNDFGSFNDDHSMSRVYDNITDARNGKRHLLPDFVT